MDCTMRAEGTPDANSSGENIFSAQVSAEQPSVLEVIEPRKKVSLIPLIFFLGNLHVFPSNSLCNPFHFLISLPCLSSI